MYFSILIIFTKTTAASECRRLTKPALMLIKVNGFNRTGKGFLPLSPKSNACPKLKPLPP
jgi:hypothetical protein